MTSSDIKQALFLRYSDPNRYVALAEFRPGTGYGLNSERYIDFYVIDCYGNHQTTAFEIKVSRADFLSEIKKPEKRRLALHFSHEFFFVTPKGLIKPEELPPECGLIEVSEDLTARQVRPALHRETSRPTWRLVASISRTLGKSAKESSYAKLARAKDDQYKLVSALRWAYNDLRNLKMAVERDGVEFSSPPYLSGRELDIEAEIEEIQP